MQEGDQRTPNNIYSHLLPRKGNKYACMVRDIFVTHQKNEKITM